MDSMTKFAEFRGIMPRHRALFTGGAFLLGIIALLAGCAPSTHVMGAIPDEKRLISIGALRALTPSAASPLVTVRGEIIVKCPVAACWFRLRDKTGEVKVDVKGAYFTVTETPLGSEVTVSGRWVKSGEDTILAATGLRY